MRTPEVSKGAKMENHPLFLLFFCKRKDNKMSFDNEICNAMGAYYSLKNDVAVEKGGIAIDNLRSEDAYYKKLYLAKAATIKKNFMIEEYSVEQIAMQLMRNHMADVMGEIEDFLNKTCKDKIVLIDYSKGKTGE